ncbi:MAG: hypothetical protein U5M51_08105 [Emticicia sp.]|nr:hypothetical protein [Emticicia sp.]
MNTVTKFSLKENAKVQIIIFDKKGKKVKELPIENLVFGDYSRQISLNELSADTFLVRLSIGEKYFGKILVVLSK